MKSHLDAGFKNETNTLILYSWEQTIDFITTADLNHVFFTLPVAGGVNIRPII